MQREIVNPWTWQDQFGFVQANKVSGAREILFCAGLVPVDPDGNLLHAGDMEAQLGLVLDNLQTLLDQAGVPLANVVKMAYYTTDIPGFMAASGVLMQRLQEGNCRPATSLLGMASLFHPDCLVEIEATAVI
jgi:enamine deaminase RidA (YjgF/YER057c/UK114 family)